MRLRWPPGRARNRKPVADVSARLHRAMGDPVVSALSGAIHDRFGNGDVASAPRQRRLESLAATAFEARRSALGGVSRGSVVDPAVPILYLGDHGAYSSSPRRIVTVGLNPSRAEFPPEDSYRRFPLASGVEGPGEDYLAALDTYFKTEPRERWFSSYESVLNGLDASYYPGAPCHALHTNLRSPVATDPMWSRLSADVEDELTRDGVPLWHELVRQLAPDVILVSIARAHLEKIEFPASEPFEITRLEEEGRRRPYVTEGRWLDVDGRRSLMVFGQASHRPFGLVSNMHKLGIGGRIVTHLRQRESGGRTARPEPLPGARV